jgi:hypothetical protein
MVRLASLSRYRIFGKPEYRGAVNRPADAVVESLSEYDPGRWPYGASIAPHRVAFVA